MYRGFLKIGAELNNVNAKNFEMCFALKGAVATEPKCWTNKGLRSEHKYGCAETPQRVE